MKCDLCNEEGLNLHIMTRSYGKGKNLLVIENIPVMTCQHCGESYLTAETLHEIERIKLHRQSFAITRPVAVAGFSIPQKPKAKALNSKKAQQFRNQVF